MLAGVASDVQSNYMSTLNEKALQVPPNLKTTVDKESEEHYSNFKAANANLFSLSSSNHQQMKHTSLSPKVRMGPAPTEMSPAHRKYHSGLMKAESRREAGEILETSPAIDEKGKVKQALENAELDQSKPDLDQDNNASSQATFLNKRQLNQVDNESLAYEDDYSMQAHSTKNIKAGRAKNASTGIGSSMLKSLRPSSHTLLHDEPVSKPIE